MAELKKWFKNYKWWIIGGSIVVIGCSVGLGFGLTINTTLTTTVTPVSSKDESWNEYKLSETFEDIDGYIGNDFTFDGYTKNLYQDENGENIEVTTKDSYNENIKPYFFTQRQNYYSASWNSKSSHIYTGDQVYIQWRPTTTERYNGSMGWNSNQSYSIHLNYGDSRFWLTLLKNVSVFTNVDDSKLVANYEVTNFNFLEVSWTNIPLNIFDSSLSSEDTSSDHFQFVSSPQGKIHVPDTANVSQFVEEKLSYGYPPFNEETINFSNNIKNNDWSDVYKINNYFLDLFKMKNLDFPVVLPTIDWIFA